jgi:hypothetical protein
MSVDYKYKPDKHKYRVNIKTIDEIHKEHLDDFNKKHEQIPEKKRRLILLEQELEELEVSMKGRPICLDFETLKRRNSLKSTTRVLRDDIENTENYNYEMEYWSRTGDVLSDYYDITNGVLYGQDFDKHNGDPENGGQIDMVGAGTNINTNINTGSRIVISDELLAITNLGRKRKLKKPVRKRNKKIELTPTKGIMNILLGDEEKNDEQDNKLCKASLQNQYLLIMDKEYACSRSKTSLVKRCKKCNVDKVIIYNESIMSCPKCGESDEIFIESDMPTQRETFADKPKYPYKKLAHCTEKLNQFLCKGTANIPQDVFTAMEEEIKKHSMDKKSVTIKFLEAMLKKHRLSDYYENIMYIYSKITGSPPQHISREEYELVLRMFKEAEEVYETKYKPSTRNNFLKYTFVLHKIFRTIKRGDIAQHFKLLKSPDKLKQQERIWQNICHDLEWKYHSSFEDGH